MVSRSFGRAVLVLCVFLLVVCPEANSQGVSQLQVPSTPPLGSDTIPVSSGMLAPLLPKLPNLEFWIPLFFRQECTHR